MVCKKWRLCGLLALCASIQAASSVNMANLLRREEPHPTEHAKKDSYPSESGASAYASERIWRLEHHSERAPLEHSGEDSPEHHPGAGVVRTGDLANEDQASEHGTDQFKSSDQSDENNPTDQIDDSDQSDDSDQRDDFDQSDGSAPADDHALVERRDDKPASKENADDSEGHDVVMDEQKHTQRSTRSKSEHSGRDSNDDSPASSAGDKSSEKTKERKHTETDTRDDEHDVVMDENEHTSKGEHSGQDSSDDGSVSSEGGKSDTRDTEHDVVMDEQEHTQGSTRSEGEHSERDSSDDDSASSAELKNIKREPRDERSRWDADSLESNHARGNAHPKDEHSEGGSDQTDANAVDEAGDAAAKSPERFLDQSLALNSKRKNEAKRDIREDAEIENTLDQDIKHSNMYRGAAVENDGHMMEELKDHREWTPHGDHKFGEDAPVHTIESHLGGESSGSLLSTSGKDVHDSVESQDNIDDPDEDSLDDDDAGGTDTELSQADDDVPHETDSEGRLPHEAESAREEDSAGGAENENDDNTYAAEDTTESSRRTFGDNVNADDTE